MQSKINPEHPPGFPPVLLVRSLNSITDLFGTSKNRCGVYLLKFDNNEYYIGQSIDAVKRFKEHCKGFEGITGFSFIEIPKKELNAKERQLIFEAEERGFILRNKTHKAIITGETNFDSLVNKEEQTQWLENPKSVNQKDKSLRIELPESQIIPFKQDYKKFSDYPKSKAVITLFQKYISSCIPFPKRTEYSFWALSCMPATKNRDNQRLAAVNMCVMETFVIFYEKASINKIWGLVNVSSDVLMDHWGSIANFAFRFPFIDIVKSDYKDAGQYQVQLRATEIENLKKLINNKSVQAAAACMNLRLMRKRATIFNMHHCKYLSDKCVV